MNVLWRSLARVSAKLIFLLSVAGCFNVVHAAELPVLGGGNAINSAGEFISTNTSFTGGASINGVDYQAYLQAVPLANVSIQARISVDPTDVGKTADLLYVIGTEISAPFDGGSDTVYISVNETRDLNDLNLYNEASVWMAQLAATPFKRGVTLQEEMTIADTEGWKLFEGPSANYYFIGYRLEDGTIVYAGMPIVSTTTGSGNSKPSFPKLVQLIPTDTDRVSLAWLPSQSDTTAADAIRYEVHLSEQANFTPSTNTLRRAVVGEHQAEITGLDTGKTYNVLIVAVDQQGNQSEKQDYRAITTFTDPVIVSKTTPFAQDKDLGLGQATTTDGVQFTYSNGGTPPQVGSVLFANVGEETALRKVETVTPTANGLIIGTSEAELSDVLEQATIAHEISLFDVDQAATRSQSVNGMSTRRSVRSDGSKHTEVRWQNNLLAAEQIDFTSRLRANDDDERFKVEPIAGFEPNIIPRFIWKLDPKTLKPIPVGVHVDISGKIIAGIKAEFNFDKAGSVQKEIQVFNRTYRSRYWLPGVPVPITLGTTLTMKAVLNATASTEIHANTEAKMETTVKTGVDMNQDFTWKRYPLEAKLEKSFTVDVSAHGKATGTVRLIPTVQVAYYPLVVSPVSFAVDASIEPILNGKIAAESIGSADLIENWGFLKTQLTQLDFDLQAEAFMGVSLRAFRRTFPLLEKTQLGETQSWQLFSLPQLSVEGGSGKVSEPIVLAAKTEDGKNNPFNEGSIQWDVYPPGKATVSGGKTGTFTATEEGTYTVFFSGASRIPAPLGRQFAQAEVSVGKKDEDKPSTLDNYIGCYKDNQDGPQNHVHLGGRDLSGNLLNSNSMTVEKCISFCNGFTYAGIEVGSWCFCGNSYGKYGVATNCTYSCAGNASQECGGYWANSVYKVK